MMPSSMTGYGRGENRNERALYTVEIKTVNHRFLDLSFKYPREIQAVEDRIRSVIKEYIQRGKTEVSINRTTFASPNTTVTPNSSLVMAYIDAVAEVEKSTGRTFPMNAGNILMIPDAFAVNNAQISDDDVWTLLEPALRGALSALKAMRDREGATLANNLIGIIDGCKKIVSEISERAPKIPAEYQAKLNARIAELIGQSADPTRLAQEVAIFADKACIDEEITRLGSHFTQAVSILSGKSDRKNGDSDGKRLDFLAQEMNREVNTIGSKANDLEITNRVLTLKCEIEKFREQIQNIE